MIYDYEWNKIDLNHQNMLFLRVLNYCNDHASKKKYLYSKLKNIYTISSFEFKKLAMAGLKFIFLVFVSIK